MSLRHQFSVGLDKAADQAGCGYYRIGLPLGTLHEKLGIQTLASTVLMPEARERADVIVGQRVCIEGASKTWQLLAKDGRRLVFEIDDDLWHVHPTNEVAAGFFSKKDVIERLTENAISASVVTVTNEGLAQVLREFNNHVVVLPNYIDESLLKHERPRNDRLTIGWAGSATHSMDFGIVAPHLRRFFSKNKEVDMHFIGCSYAQAIRLPGARSTGWSMDVAEYQKTVDFDIGIAPLRYDIFNSSKSYIKALEYGALGIPIVASDIGPYRDYVKHGVTGFLVNHGWEWTKYLNMLSNDEGLRKSMGDAAREQAKDYTIQAHIHKWLKVYADLMES